ncbi:MAG: tyrosine-type recombinase/integrase [Treponema sp.]|jgi:site-specific recombinase XerD|nr:tyrosine-type recombinase/integrase [Treponema sp.]
MDVVYLFYTEDRIIIPFFDFDPWLGKRLAGCHSGYWDRHNSRYILKYRLSKKQYNETFAGRPFLEVRDDGVRINSFFGRAWPGCAEDKPISLPGFKKPECFLDAHIELLTTELHSRKYSRRTIGMYIHYNRALCRHLQKSPEEMTDFGIKAYLAYLDQDCGLSASSMNLALSAVRFFYNEVLKRGLAAEQFRPAGDRRLPAVLDQSEVFRLLDMEQNPKHRLLLMITYSSGLRVSEVVALKKKHIDFVRKTILVHNGKGRKDRYTILSSRTSDFIQKYCALFNIENWLFPGQNSRRHMTIRSAQHIFEKAFLKARIPKAVSIHSLRHTFATHLLENGTDIRYIQDLLGHTSITTTERYTHIARRSILKIKSPLD